MEMTSEGAHIARHEAVREAASPLAGEYLTWRLGDEEYGVDIHTVQEIRCYEPPTRVPAAPPWIKGVVNLRGAIVPIADLRLKLGAQRAEYTPLTVVIVLSARGRLAGVVVDAVSEVIDLPTDAIRPPPGLAGEQGPDFVTGLATIDQRMLMLVDMGRLLGASLGDAAP
ncbi:chemotaxis protein CheW [Ramlibacter alkalitolerans]|uniref:Chemotaxis protein CheW n=1 Tax=Ramlibacter alkalitolerans TaxID=2039631 RepID=A0ABS1JKY9_9BURK|nr:chemotaxis protein CheW [Ramlibacter alkalitolerans]MBL0424897.1 purine-binding chemotaxis protein CheW [Ramlibacter alkalitolerans]